MEDAIKGRSFDRPFFCLGNFLQLSTMILICKCNNIFQDKQYGFGKRIHNPSHTKPQARCTVCGDVKSTSSGEMVKSGKKVKK